MLINKLLAIFVVPSEKVILANSVQRDSENSYLFNFMEKLNLNLILK